MIFLSRVHKNFGYIPVLENFSMAIYPGERVGLIGANGSGKTTVFRMIMGQETPDQGSVTVAGNPSFGYLTQIPQGSLELTVQERLLQGVDCVVKMEEALRTLESQLSRSESGGQGERDSIMTQYARMFSEFERLGGYQYESRVNSVAQGLGIVVPRDALLRDVSGGERARIELAVVLLSEPDVLLLDEPTNHLDLAALTWLEDYIIDFKGTVLIISHDRYFLDRVIQKIVEIEGGAARDFAGNYSFYLEERERLHDQALRQYQNQQKEIRRKEAAIKQLRQWAAQSDNAKFYKRAASMEKQLAKVERLDRPDDGEPGFSLRFAAQRSGKEVVSMENVSHGFDARLLFQDVDWQIRYGERLGLIGPNGSGKSTLIKILLGEIMPRVGSVKLGAGLKIGYLAQHQELLDDERSLLGSLRELLPTMPESRVRAILAKYGFPGDLVFRQANTLSGGERVRFHLLKLVRSEVNCLILDEPTNHLDLASIEILEEALADYGGTLLVVSHDRFFLNKVVQMIYAMEEQQLVLYLGNYEYYRQKSEERKDQRFPADAGTTKQNPSPPYKAQKSRIRVPSHQALQQELHCLEANIGNLERQLAETQQAMAEPGKQSDYLYLQSLQKESQALEQEIDRLFQRWGEVAGLLDNWQV
jgi:ATP-binding cassette subfamily F protein 3